jgi:hypothetical protein
MVENSGTPDVTKNDIKKAAAPSANALLVIIKNFDSAGCMLLIANRGISQTADHAIHLIS